MGKSTGRTGGRWRPQRGELAAGEPHPAALNALTWIKAKDPAELHRWLESFASCALSGNRVAEVCAATLDRIITGKPVSDRYVLGLAWAMRE